MKQKYLLAAAMFAAIPFAQAADEALDEVVVTATRSEQALAQALSHTSIITRKEIDASLAADVPALLKSLAGVEFYQSGGIGKQGSLFLRGTNSGHVLVLVDGVRIGSATTGATAIDQLMLDQVERIEVVRGNVSSLYGSEAIGGVIQIFTRRGKGDPAFNGSIGAGSHNTQRAAAGFSGQLSATSFSVQVSKYRTDGVSAVRPDIVASVNPDLDGYDNSSVSAQASHAFSDAHSLSASLLDSKADNRYDNAYGATADADSSQSHIQKAGVVSENRFGDGWQSRLTLAQGSDDLNSYRNGVRTDGFRTRSDQLSWQNTVKLGSASAMLLGVERLAQQVSGSTAFTRTSRTSDSAFAGYTGNYGVQQVQINLRRDRYSDFGTANTWLLGYGFDVSEVWRVTASLATAFKAPTFNDMYYPFVDYGWGYSYSGNPNLRPEHSRNSEMGLHYAGAGHKLDVVYFDNRIRGLIVYDNQPAATMVNLDEARIDGAELAYNGQFGDTGVKLAATWQNPRDARTGKELLRRAKNFASAGVARQIGALRLGGEWQHSGERQDNDINTFTRTTLRAYDVVNLTATYAWSKRLELALRVDNLFNRDYMLAHGYSTPGRTLFVGMSYR